jgi:putative thioredoxin
VVQARAALALAREATPVDDLDDLRRRSAAAPDDLALRYELAGGFMARGDRDAAADELLESIRRDRSWNEGAARDRLLKLFEAVGLGDPWVVATRRRLSTILFS